MYSAARMQSSASAVSISGAMRTGPRIPHNALTPKLLGDSKGLREVSPKGKGGSASMPFSTAGSGSMPIGMAGSGSTPIGMPPGLRSVTTHQSPSAMKMSQSSSPMQRSASVSPLPHGRTVSDNQSDGSLLSGRWKRVKAPLASTRRLAEGPPGAEAEAVCARTPLTPNLERAKSCIAIESSVSPRLRTPTSRTERRSPSCEVPPKAVSDDVSHIEDTQSNMLKQLQNQVSALKTETQALSSKFEWMAVDLLVSRAELRSCCFQHCADLEARMTTRVKEIQTMVEAEATIIDAIQSRLSEKAESQGSFEVVGLKKSPTHQQEVGLSGSPEDEPSRTARIVNEVADHVIQRVNADPRICQVVESHQAIQDSFTKLMAMLEKSRAESEKKESRNILALYDSVFETQKTCKSLAVELRQIRQRRNQDCSDNAVRFGDLEGVLQSIKGSLSPDGTPGAVFAANCNDFDAMKNIIMEGVGGFNGRINEICERQERKPDTEARAEEPPDQLLVVPSLICAS